MDLDDVKLTKEQKTWFSDRMDEGPTGRVRIPTHLINKMRMLAGDMTIPTYAVRTYLIDKCY